MQAAEGRLKVAQRRLDEAQADYNSASLVYAAQMQTFQQEFYQLYRPEYAGRLAVLSARYHEEQVKRNQVFIVTQFLPGKYEWTEGGRSLAEIEITADGGISGVPPEAQKGIWEVTDDGLVVTVGKEKWLFKPGPVHTLMGNYKEPGSTIVKRSALLKPKVLPDEAAYQAALKTLKEASAQKALLAQEAAASAVGDPATAGKPTYVLKIEALVDGDSWLVLRGNKAHWANKTGGLPGDSGKDQPDGSQPTLLDGKPWKPVWEGQVSAPTELPFALPADLSDVKLSVKTLHGRSQPTALVHDGALVVDIDDVRPGADRYVLELSIYQSAAAAQPTVAAAAPAPPVAGPRAAAPPPQQTSQPNLNTPVTLAAPYPASYPGAPTDRISLQYAVKEIARQAGLGYDFDASMRNTNPICRKWVTPNLRGMPFQQAMVSLLAPEGLTYDIVQNGVVLRRK